VNPAKFCKQHAIYWAPAGKGPNGEDTYASEAEVIGARWDVDEGEKPTGVRLLSEFMMDEPVIGRTTVMVDQVVEVGGLLMQGEQEDLCDLVDEGYVPKANDDGIFVIRQFLTNPTVSAKKFLYRAIC